MSDLPSWFIDSNGLEPGAAVLPVGRHTVPFRLPESEGGDPAGWWVGMTHAQMATFNEDETMTVTLTGTWDIDWSRLKITEGGNAASCAWHIEWNTGENVSFAFEFVETVTIPANGCVAIAGNNYGTIGNGLGGVSDDDTESDTVTVVDDQTANAICSSTGCTSGDLPTHDDGGTRTIDAIHGPGGILEALARDKATGGFLYRMDHGSTVTVDGFGLTAYLYTGDYDDARLFTATGLVLPLPTGYTLSDEIEAGSFRGIPVKARVITYEEDHSASSITGSPGNCPTPSYSYDVTTGETTSTLEVSVSG